MYDNISSRLNFIGDIKKRERAVQKVVDCYSSCKDVLLFHIFIHIKIEKFIFPFEYLKKNQSSSDLYNKTF